MSSKLRDALEQFSAIDLSKLKFPLYGDLSAIYNSDKKEITIPYWMVAKLFNAVKATQDMVKSALAEPLRNCEVGTPEEQNIRHDKYCFKHSKECDGIITYDCIACFAKWAQMPYEEVK